MGVRPTLDSRSSCGSDVLLEGRLADFSRRFIWEMLIGQEGCGRKGVELRGSWVESCSELWGSPCWR